VGKSSLFNLLLQEDRAIVSDIPGTTRDVVDSSILLDGVRVLFSDTAGIRNSQDKVEQIGISRSRESQKDADLNLYLYDVQLGFSDVDLANLEELPQESLLLIGNKIDISGTQANAHKAQLQTQLDGFVGERKFFKNPSHAEPFLQEKVLFISTLEHKYRELVLTAIRSFLRKSQLEDIAVISQARHFDNLCRALKHVSQTRKAFEENAENELMALDLKEALIAVHETLGKRFDDQIMDQVFKQFCIGK
jgi:tRNA modification GTPase